MESIATTRLNKKEITNLIDMALESKMSWSALAYLLRDITTYDPETVVVTLLKALEKLYLNTLRKDIEDSLPNADDTENNEDQDFTEATSIEYIEENKIFEENEDNNETIENDYDIEFIDVDNGTFDTENHFDLKERKYHTEEYYNDKYFGVGINAAHEIDNEWYTSFSKNKVFDAKTVEYTQMNIQGKESEENEFSIATN